MLDTGLLMLDARYMDTDHIFSFLSAHPLSANFSNLVFGLPTSNF
jgi:hypothetical protein